MRLAISLTPPSLDEAFAFAETLSRRPGVTSEPVMSDHQWEQAVTAAVTRGDRGGLAILLQVELVPAIARALVAMADTVRCAIASSKGQPEACMLELAERLDPTQLAVTRAGKAIWAGEHREGLLPGHAPPPSPHSNATERAWSKMVDYVHMEMARDDVRQVIADDLGKALRELTHPAQAAIECMDMGAVDDLLPYPLQQALVEAYDALSAVRLHLLATYLAETMAMQTLSSDLS
ncbi:MAG: hypothetical protein AAGF11_12340 [Myxococcota bacterium]